jgi:ectoine hydroxylase-related dioxygenase (phytanoyl-CoA dioxygenase family)
MEISKNIRRLSKSEISQYDSDGFIKNLPVFSERGVEELQIFFNELKTRLPSSVDINKTNMWHKASKKFYDVAHTPEILDYVEDLLGLNFYLWGGQFFYKPALSKSIVPWHQDSQYWPLNPSNSVTVWLAVFDTDKDNSAMKIVSGSHKTKKYLHTENNNKDYILNKEVDDDQIDKNKIVFMNLKAGEISLHSDALLHGSNANTSDRPRCGITFRYSPSHVKADLNEWPFFSIQIARGSKKHTLNPVAPIPRGEATPIGRFQFHQEFESQWK